MGCTECIKIMTNVYQTISYWLGKIKSWSPPPEVQSWKYTSRHLTFVLDSSPSLWQTSETGPVWCTVDKGVCCQTRGPCSSSKLPVVERRINSHTVSSDHIHTTVWLNPYTCKQNKEDILTLKLILEVGIWHSGRVLAQQVQVPGFGSQFWFCFVLFFKKISFLIIRVTEEERLSMATWSSCFRLWHQCTEQQGMVEEI